MSYLEKQMANMKINTPEGQQPPKKLGPAVPPKPKKSQPQVPKSYALNGPCEPSYTSPLQSSSNDKRPNIGPIYSNVNLVPSIGNSERDKKVNLNNTYSNMEVFNKTAALYKKAEPQAPLYSNLSENASYSNVPSYANIDEIPPIPEPYETDYGDFPPPPADLPPPPSPVSSSYSELRRATNVNPMPEYATYASSSQASSAYDSIYEPITPRPPSGLSSRSNYSLYAPYVKGSRVPHEAEVDALTDLLVQSMDSPTTESDIFGDCCKCGEKVVGEGNGCTAMDRVYHIECFTCSHCAIQLQGKPFYILEGNPYCEAGYLQTLEKCSVCLKPILDRILRATGRPYHPKCFCCVVCGKSLDGIPFTVDATNQIHCIEDFHKKFAPRCCVCQLPIMPEPGQDETVRVVALDRSFHIACYKCEDCGLVLSSEAEGRGCYPLDDHVLCKSCNAKRVQALTSHMTTEL